MATGWPMKTTYANGDVYSASDVNDITGTINLLGSSVVYAAGKNVIQNSNFNIWQRGTTGFTFTSSQYFADRWTYTLAGTVTGANISVTRDTSVPNGNSQYSMKVTQTTGTGSSLSEYTSRQWIEAFNILPLIGKTVTLSFWYKSNKTGAHGIRIQPQNVTGGSDFSSTFTVNAANTWEYKTVTTAVPFGSGTAFTGTPTNAGALVDIGFRVLNSGFTSVATSDYYQIAQFQLEQGSSATAFQTAGGSIGGELELCQRYFEVVNGAGLWGMAYSTTQIIVNAAYKVQKRIDPTLTGLRTAVSINNMAGGSYKTSTGSTYLFNANTAQGFYGLSAAINGFTGLTANTFVTVNDTNDIISASADL